MSGMLPNIVEAQSIARSPNEGQSVAIQPHDCQNVYMETKNIKKKKWYKRMILYLKCKMFMEDNTSSK